VRFEPGRLEFELAPGLPQLRKPEQRLQSWTGDAGWCRSSKAAGSDITERREAAARERLPGGRSGDRQRARGLSRAPIVPCAQDVEAAMPPLASD